MKINGGPAKIALLRARKKNRLRDGKAQKEEKRGKRKCPQGKTPITFESIRDNIRLSVAAQNRFRVRLTSGTYHICTGGRGKRPLRRRPELWPVRGGGDGAHGYPPLRFNVQKEICPLRGFSGGKPRSAWRHIDQPHRTGFVHRPRARIDFLRSYSKQRRLRKINRKG